MLKMKITPKISPRIIPNIASLYHFLTRIIMEFIDNSFDSAENMPSLLGENSNSDYATPVEITVAI